MQEEGRVRLEEYKANRRAQRDAAGAEDDDDDDFDDVEVEYAQ